MGPVVYAGETSWAFFLAWGPGKGDGMGNVIENAREKENNSESVLKKDPMDLAGAINRLRLLEGALTEVPEIGDLLGL